MEPRPVDSILSSPGFALIDDLCLPNPAVLRGRRAGRLRGSFRCYMAGQMRRLSCWRGRKFITARLTARRRLACADVLAVDCTAEELRLIGELDLTSLMAEHALCQNYFPASTCGSHVPIYCLGVGTDLKALPRIVQEALCVNNGLAYYERQFDAVFIRLCESLNRHLRHVVIHECAHAFLDRLMIPYRPPRIVEEGLAVSMEIRYSVNPAAADRHVWSFATRCDSLTEFLTMRGLDGPLDGMECHDAYKALAYIGSLAHKNPSISGFLEQIRRERVKRIELAAWLEKRLDKKLDTSGFNEFCEARGRDQRVSASKV